MTYLQVVGLFVVLAMVLRRKPDVLISVLPTLNEKPKYHGQEKLPLIVWMVAQVSQWLDNIICFFGNGISFFGSINDHYVII